MVLCREAGAEVLSEEHVGMTGWMFPEQQGAPSASRLPHWGSENHRVVLMADGVSVHPHKGSHKIHYLQIPDTGVQ